MAVIYTLMGDVYTPVIDPERGIVLRKAARKRVASPGQMSLFGSNDPKEGDTKVVDGVTYQLNQHSRWERADKAKGKGQSKPKAVVPVVEEKGPNTPSDESDVRALADLVKMRHYYTEPTKMDKGELDKAPVLRDYLVNAGLVEIRGDDAFLMPDARLPDFVKQDFPELAQVDEETAAAARRPKISEKEKVQEEKPKREFMSNRRKVQPWMVPNLLDPDITEEEESDFLAYSDDGISGFEPDREEGEWSDHPWTEKDLELRPLIGSPKQEKWATDIRERALKNFWEDGDYPRESYAEGWDRYAQAALKLPIEAKWWIDNRDKIYAAIAEKMGVKYSAGLRMRWRR